LTRRRVVGRLRIDTQAFPSSQPAKCCVSRPRGCHRGASLSPYPGLKAGSGVASLCAESRFGERMWRNRANLSQNALSRKPQTPWPFSTPGCAKQAVACAFQGATSTHSFDEAAAPNVSCTGEGIYGLARSLRSSYDSPPAVAIPPVRVPLSVLLSH